MQVVAHLSFGDSMTVLAPNTCLGWPWTYWEHGVLPVAGFLIVGYIAVHGLAAIVFAIDSETDLRTRQECTFWAFLAFVGVCVLLQVLPATTGGFQLIPLPVWYYTGWVSWIVSLLCWLVLALAVFLGVFGEPRDKPGAAGFLLIAIGLNALLSFATPVGVTPVAAQRSTEKPTDTIARWEELKVARSETLSKLRSDRDGLLTRIRSIGAKSKKEFMENPLGRTLVDEYEQLCHQIVTVQQEVNALDSAIERAKSRLRMAERKGNGRLTEKEQDALSELDHQLELRHAPGHEVRLDKLLDEVLKGCWDTSLRFCRWTGASRTACPWR